MNKADWSERHNLLMVWLSTESLSRNSINCFDPSFSELKELLWNKQLEKFNINQILIVNELL